MASEKQAGSPKGESIYLAIGYLRRPHGVSGEIVMDLHTDFPDRIQAGRKVYIGEKHEAATFGSVRGHGNGLLVTLDGYDTPETVGRFRNQWVYVQTREVPSLPEGQYYQYELIGVDVVDDNDNPLGRIVEILETGANNVYLVKDDSGREILLPAIPSVILDLDMTQRSMKVHLLDGLIENRDS